MTVVSKFCCLFRSAFSEVKISGWLLALSSNVFGVLLCSGLIVCIFGLGVRGKLSEDITRCRLRLGET